MRHDDNFQTLCRALQGPGAFLVAENKKGRVNVMTIGWAQLGVIWGEPVMTVLVRPSRHTHSVLEEAASFSVCVPREGELGKELAFCGSKSGRDYDKVRACALKLAAGPDGVKYLAGCELVYRCAILARTNLDRARVEPGPLAKYYPGSDAPHTLYFGKVLKAERFR